MTYNKIIYIPHFSFTVFIYWVPIMFFRKSMTDCMVEDRGENGAVLDVVTFHWVIKHEKAFVSQVAMW